MEGRDNRKIKVAVCAYKKIRLEEMAELAMQIQQTGTGDLDVALYLYEHLEPGDALMRRIRDSGVGVLRVDTDNPAWRHANLIAEHDEPLGGGAPAGDSIGGRLKKFLIRAGRSLLRRLGKSSIACFWRERRLLGLLRDNYRNTLPLFREYGADVLMVIGDRHRTMEPVLLRIARETGARIVIPYVAFYAEPDELASKYRRKPPNPSGFFPLYDRLAERRLRHTSRNGAWFYPHWHARALQKFGVLSPNPWVMGAGVSDVLCLPNGGMMEDYRDYGIDPDRLHVVGDVSYDRLHRAWAARDELRETLAGRYGLDPEKKTVILALPPLAEHGDMDWDRHDREIALLVRSACQLGANTLVSLHPKMNHRRYESLEEHFRCRLLQERLVDVLPAADFFMASFSSTVLWAVLCGIKSAVVDFYGFNYHYYDRYDSVEVIRSRDELASRLEQGFRREVDFSGDWELMSRKKVFFGKTVENYIELVRDLG